MFRLCLLTYSKVAELTHWMVKLAPNTLGEKNPKIKSDTHHRRPAPTHQNQIMFFFCIHLPRENIYSLKIDSAKFQMRRNICNSAQCGRPLPSSSQKYHTWHDHDLLLQYSLAKPVMMEQCGYGIHFAVLTILWSRFNPLQRIFVFWSQSRYRVVLEELDMQLF